MADAMRKLAHTAAELDAAVDMMLEVYTREETDKLLSLKVDAVSGSGLMTDSEREKLSALDNYDDTAVRELIASETTSRLEADNRLSEEITALAARVKALEDAQAI